MFNHIDSRLKVNICLDYMMSRFAVKCIIWIMICVNAADKYRSIEVNPRSQVFCTCEFVKCVKSIGNSEHVHTFLMPLTCECFTSIVIYHHGGKPERGIFELYETNVQIGKFSLY